MSLGPDYATEAMVYLQMTLGLDYTTEAMVGLNYSVELPNNWFS